MLAGICMQEKMDLYIVQNSTPKAAQYINEILDVYVRPYAAIGLSHILMDDKSRPHRARVTNRHLQAATMERTNTSQHGPQTLIHFNMLGTC